MKKLFIIPTVLVGIAGGFALAQTELLSSAEKMATITAAEAKEIALKTFDGKIIEFDFDKDDAVPHYEFEMKNASEKIELDVNAATGEAIITEREAVKAMTPSNGITNVKTEVLDDDDDDDDVQTKKTEAAQTQVNATTAKENQVPKTAASTTIITKEQAITIAQKMASGKVVKAKLDTDDGVQVYEIELRNGNVEYEFEINAMTGEIIEFEEDLDDDN